MPKAVFLSYYEIMLTTKSVQFHSTTYKWHISLQRWLLSSLWLLLLWPSNYILRQSFDDVRKLDFFDWLNRAAITKATDIQYSAFVRSKSIVVVQKFPSKYHKRSVEYKGSSLEKSLQIQTNLYTKLVWIECTVIEMHIILSFHFCLISG